MTALSDEPAGGVAEDTRGDLVTAGIPPSSYGFARIELSYQQWWTMPWKHVLKLDAFAGGIGGDAPFFEKFYVGDFTDLLPDRVLDLAPDRRQPPNYLDTDIIEVRYGDFAARLELEYRVPIYAGKGSIYGVDLFARHFDVQLFTGCVHLDEIEFGHLVI